MGLLTKGKVSFFLNDHLKPENNSPITGEKISDFDKNRRKNGIYK